ncbi:ADP-ribosylation factor-like protein 2-binding protein [Chamberlinius hualienensis]
MDHSGFGDQSEEVIMCSDDNQATPFDQTVGHIEDIIISVEMEMMVKEFLDKHYMVFEELGDNKLEYMTIFQEYQVLIEKYLESELVKRQPGFSMQAFSAQLTRERQTELEGEVFQILLSLTDFLLFKELMLDYKKEKISQGARSGSDLIVTSLSNLKLFSK